MLGALKRLLWGLVESPEELEAKRCLAIQFVNNVRLYEQTAKFNQFAAAETHASPVFIQSTSSTSHEAVDTVNQAGNPLRPVFPSAPPALDPVIRAAVQAFLAMPKVELSPEMLKARAQRAAERKARRQAQISLRSERNARRIPLERRNPVIAQKVETNDGSGSRIRRKLRTPTDPVVEAHRRLYFLRLSGKENMEDYGDLILAYRLEARQAFDDAAAATDPMNATDRKRIYDTLIHSAHMHQSRLLTKAYKRLEQGLDVTDLVVGRNEMTPTQLTAATEDLRKAAKEQHLKRISREEKMAKRKTNHHVGNVS